jgi:hypothetical protein
MSLFALTATLKMEAEDSFASLASPTKLHHAINQKTSLTFHLLEKLKLGFVFHKTHEFLNRPNAMIWIAESKHSLFSWLLFQGHAV